MGYYKKGNLAICDNMDELEGIMLHEMSPRNTNQNNRYKE